MESIFFHKQEKRLIKKRRSSAAAEQQESKGRERRKHASLPGFLSSSSSSNSFFLVSITRIPAVPETGEERERENDSFIQIDSRNHFKKEETRLTVNRRTLTKEQDKTHILTSFPFKEFGKSNQQTNNEEGRERERFFIFR